nr:aminotransferase class I/II-fold pyridoxal phosphate-dependent enzyme [Aureispira sp. CCB-QB1]
MKITLNRQNDFYHFLAQNESGARLELDAAPSIGGQNKGFRPMESLLAGLGGCSAIDIISILKKQRQEIIDFQIEIEANRDTEAVPAIFKDIEVKIIITGTVDEKKLQKAIDLTVDKYCSVYHILKETAAINYSYELVPASPKKVASTTYKAETLAIRTQTAPTHNREHSAPLYLTSSFTFENAEQARAVFAGEEEAHIYSRFSNPNASEFIQKMCLLEGTEDGFATASGMSSIFASLAPFLKKGDHLIACRSVFGNTHRIITEILPEWGVDYTYVDIDQPETWEAAIQPNTKMLFAETPSNPALDFIDLEWLGKLTKKHNILLNIDNCFATPYLQRPSDYGADLVVHSATKWIDGQGRVLGGLVLGKKELVAKVYAFARRTGPSISPFNAWILSKSLETLAVRMECHSANAYALASYLEHHPEIESVKYPHLPSHPQFDLAKRQMKLGGGLFTCIVKGGLERGRRFLDALELLSLTANLGDTRTIATHPASTTHSKLSTTDREAVGILDGLIRFSVGLEHLDDLINDINQALEKSK